MGPTTLRDSEKIARWIWKTYYESQGQPPTYTEDMIERDAGVTIDASLRVDPRFIGHLNARIEQCSKLKSSGKPQPAQNDWIFWIAAGILGCPKIYVGSLQLQNMVSGPAWHPDPYPFWWANLVCSSLELSIRSQGSQNAAVNATLEAVAMVVTTSPADPNGIRDLKNRLY